MLAALQYDLPMQQQKTWIGTMNKLERLPDGTFVEVEIGRNQVVLSGLHAMTQVIYGKKEPIVKFSTFEDELFKTPSTGGENEMTVENQKNQIQAKDQHSLPFLQGYNLAYDGAQGDGILPYPRHKLGYDFDHLIPFRMIPMESNDYKIYKDKYLHSRVVTIKGKQFVQYFTKKIDIKLTAQQDDGTLISHNPETTLTTDKDSRMMAEFTVQMEKDEGVEFFTIFKKGGAKATMYNSVITMYGKEAQISLNGQQYATMIDTVCFSRCNHVPVPHGVDGNIICRYRMMHI